VGKVLWKQWQSPGVGQPLFGSPGFSSFAEHQQEVAGVLAFSPGENLDAPDAVYDTAAKSILAVAPAQQKTQFVPHIAGVHGSSTVREESRRRIGKLAGCGGISRQF
jgi:hypothetical protein